MARTFAVKILERAAGRAVEPGDTVEFAPDVVLTQGNTRDVVQSFQALNGIHAVKRPGSCVIVESSNAACSPLTSTPSLKRFAEQHGMNRYYGAGCGNGHQILAEQHLALPGSIIVGTDSETCISGAFNCFAITVSPGDAALVWAGGALHATVPESCEINLHGHFQYRVSATDLILTVLGSWGNTAAKGRVIEFHGPSIGSLLTYERMTLAALCSATGALTAVFPADRITQQYLFSQELCEGALWSDADSCFAETLDLNLDELVPMVARPGGQAALPVSQLADVKVDSIFIGTCAGGRVEDLKEVLEVMKGRPLAPGVRMTVSPASRDEFLKALQQGFIEEFVKAGAVILPPGECHGAWVDSFFLDHGDVCLATGFPVACGHAFHTAGPFVAAAAAVTGKIADPRLV